MIDPKHILITGASSGIGAALALEYAKEGVTLSLSGRDAERLKHTAARATARRAAVSTHLGDVTDSADMAAWIAARDAVLPIDLVIANAGISASTSNVDSLQQQLKAVFDVNVTGVFNTVLPALPLMILRKRGQIAIISSLASFRGFAGSSAYAASKGAVRLYGEALRGEMAPHQVEVNVVCPGFIKTPMTDVNRFKMPFLMSQERAARLIRQGLEANRARIAFPWQMYWAVMALSLLPQTVTDFVAARMPRK